MLKNVVFPAPFGPIRLTMERSGMLKSTESTATSPPKTLVIPRASRMLAVSVTFSGTGPFPRGSGLLVVLVQLLGPLSVGYYPFRPQEHHQHQNQDAEDHYRRPAGPDVLVGHRPDDPDQEPPYHRPCQVSDSSEDGRSERVEPLGEAHVEDGYTVEETVHNARGPGEDAAEQERDGNGAVHVDADHGSRLLVLGHGPHHLALFGAPDEVGEGEEERHGHQDHEQILPPEDDGVAGQDVGVGDEFRKRHLGRPLPYQAHVLQDEGHPDSGDENRQPRGVSQGLIRHPLYSDVQEAAGQHSHEEGYQDAKDPQKRPRSLRDRREKLEAEDRTREDGEADERADHEVVAVGEVDQLDDPVDQRVTQGHEREYRAVGKADEKLGRELRRFLHGLY